MILKALVDYARRSELMKDPDTEERRVGCLVRVADGGRLLGFESTFEPDAKGKPVPKRFRVPRGEGRTSGDLAFFLCDKSDYVLGFLDDPKKAAKGDKVVNRRRLFTARVKEAADATGDAGLRAVVTFLETSDPADLRANLPEKHPPGEQYAFVYDPDGARLVHERDAVREYWRKFRAQGNGGDDAWTCLVTGEPCDPESTHPKIKGVRGTPTSGGSLVSFNFAAATSFGLEQSQNAPVGRDAAEAYTTALNHLLAPGRKRSIGLSDDTVACFWTRENAGGIEDHFADLLGSGDDVYHLYDAPKSGKAVNADVDRDRFYALTLSGAQGRIIVRDWFESSVGDVVEKVRQHFEDLALAYPYEDPPRLGLYGLLRAVVLQGDAKNIPPNLAAGVYGAVLRGGPYPLTWLAAAVRRNRAEGPMPPDRNDRPDWRRAFLRAAVIKACLARGARLKTIPLPPEEVSPMLDTSNTNQGYCLGRLFCVLERLQATAINNPNATIADRFFGAASANPVTVFPRLVRMAQNHAGKVEGEHKGLGIWYQKMVTDIQDLLDPKSGYPSTLDLKDQGMFALGYYHQRAEMFRKRDKETETVAAEPADLFEKE
jgi:CRISPR-associated protein Csd1